MREPEPQREATCQRSDGKRQPRPGLATSVKEPPDAHPSALRNLHSESWSSQSRDNTILVCPSHVLTHQTPGHNETALRWGPWIWAVNHAAIDRLPTIIVIPIVAISSGHRL